MRSQRKMRAGTGVLNDYELPLFNLPGNHDVKDVEGLPHYHRYLGPDNYSFNVGNCHFVLLNFLRLKEPGLVAWIKQDVALAPKRSTRAHWDFIPARQRQPGGGGRRRQRRSKSCGVAAFDRQGKKRWHFNTDSGIKNNIAAGTAGCSRRASRGRFTPWTRPRGNCNGRWDCRKR